MTTDPVVAADFLLRRGRAPEAWRLLREHGAVERAPITARASALSAGDAEVAGKLERSTARLVETLGDCLGKAGRRWRLFGMPFHQIERMARVRLIGPHQKPMKMWIRGGQASGSEDLPTTDFTLPIRASCRLTLHLELIGQPDTEAAEDRLELVHIDGSVLYTTNWRELERYEPVRVQIHCSMPPPRDHRLALQWRSTRRGFLTIHALEVAWSPREIARRELERLAQQTPAASDRAGGLRFEPFLVLDQVHPSAEALHLRFQSLREDLPLTEDLPPLAVRIEHRRRGRWLTAGRWPLRRIDGAGGRYWEVAIPNEFTGPDGRFSVIADVEIAPGALRSHHGTRVPILDVLKVANARGQKSVNLSRPAAAR